LEREQVHAGHTGKKESGLSAGSLNSIEPLVLDESTCTPSQRVMLQEKTPWAVAAISAGLDHVHGAHGGGAHHVQRPQDGLCPPVHLM
jgi:hypothetical protein